MGIVRLLTMVLLVLAASLPGAMVADHATTHDSTLINATASAPGHDGCCDDGAEHASVCHILAAVIPAVVVDRGAIDLTRSVSFAAAILPEGIEPVGILDPPRGV